MGVELKTAVFFANSNILSILQRDVCSMNIDAFYLFLWTHGFQTRIGGYAADGTDIRAACYGCSMKRRTSKS